MKPTIGDDLKVYYRFIVLSKYKPQPLKCTFNNNGQNQTLSISLSRVKKAERESGRKPKFEFINGRKNYLKVRGFSYTDEIKTFIKSSKHLRHNPVIVADLRGNPGGSSPISRDWFKGLTSQTLYFNSMHELTSEVTLQGDFNWPFQRLNTGKKSDKTGLKRNNKLLLEAEDNLKKFQAKNNDRPFKKWKVTESKDMGTIGDAPERFRGSIVILTDSNCASSCEGFIMKARQIKKTLVFGENTSGTGEFGQIRPYQLPNSKIWFQVPYKWFTNPNPRLKVREGTGFLPDFWLDTANPLPIIEKVEQCIVKGDCSYLFDVLHE